MIRRAPDRLDARQADNERIEVVCLLAHRRPAWMLPPRIPDTFDTSQTRPDRRR
jgi:hypothetical protein